MKDWGQSKIREPRADDWKLYKETEDAYWYTNGAGEIVSVPKH